MLRGQGPPQETSGENACPIQPSTLRKTLSSAVRSGLSIVSIPRAPDYNFFYSYIYQT